MDALLVQSKLGFGKARATRDIQYMGPSSLSRPLLDDQIQKAYPCIQDLKRISASCRKERSHAHTLRLHDFMLQIDLETHQLLGNFLVPMLANVGNLHDAQLVFDRMVRRNVCAWNSLISGFVKHGKPRHALTLYEKMQQDDYAQPDVQTFLAIFKACVALKDLERGCSIHADVVRFGFLERTLTAGNALIDMYAKCNALTKAKQVFDSLPFKNVVTWTSLLGGYAECGHGREALDCFKEMQLQGVTPNPVTIVCSLKACTITGDMDKGRDMHAEIARRGLNDVFLGSALVNMYAKHGLLVTAREVFDRIPSKNVATWNSLLLGYSEYKLGEEAVKFFIRMQSEDVCLTNITLLCGLKACGSIGALDKIGEIHVEIDRRGLLERDFLIGSTLVDMYARCGCLAKAEHVFDNLPVCDVVSWTALLAGYAQLGESKSTMHFFDKMLRAGVKPDSVAFVVVLNACSRTGLYDKSETYFHLMSKVHGIAPLLEHHSCMLDLLGRVGLLGKALIFLRQMPFDPNLVVWHSILGACKSLGNTELGKEAFEHTVSLDEADSAASAFMSHMCSLAAGGKEPVTFKHS